MFFVFVFIYFPWCFKLKTDEKVLYFNYCLKNYSGSFLTKKMVKKGIIEMKVWT